MAIDPQILRLTAFSVQVLFVFSVFVFCALQIGLDKVDVGDRSWYFSTIAFLIGLMLPQPKPSTADKTGLAPTGITPTASNNPFFPPSTPEHQAQVPEVHIVEPQKV